MDFVDGWGRHVSTFNLAKSFQTELVRRGLYIRVMSEYWLNDGVNI